MKFREEAHKLRVDPDVQVDTAEKPKPKGVKKIHLLASGIALILIPMAIPMSVLALSTAHIGKISGRKTSEAKKRSSHENGLKGRRPKQRGNSMS